VWSTVTFVQKISVDADLWFRWGFTPDPTRDYPSLDPDQLALDLLFVSVGALLRPV
jgi:hypothetical protein